jgi:L-ascorbate metabolism protein UlaG (beta-lactamase superfamily)
MAEIITIKQDLSLANDLLATNPLDDLNVWWLGQAGFAFRFGKFSMLIDPYLSDSLAKKYKSSEFPHIRMMTPPLKPYEARHINYILCTHRHADHMDAETIMPIFANNPCCKCLFPRAWEKHLIDFGAQEKDLITINNEEVVNLNDKISVKAIPSAHESLEVDAEGNHLYLGYIIKFKNITIYHSGDCVPYNGLLENLQKYKIDIAFLPINGRDEFRKSRGIPGNFTFEEASKLCLDAKIKYLIPHHFGLFDFNTISLDELKSKIAKINNKGLATIVPEINKKYLLI